MACGAALVTVVFGETPDAGLGCTSVLRASVLTAVLANRRAGLRSGIGGGGVLGMSGDNACLGYGESGRENGMPDKCLEATRTGGAFGRLMIRPSSRGTRRVLGLPRSSRTADEPSRNSQMAFLLLMSYIGSLSSFARGLVSVSSISRLT